MQKKYIFFLGGHDAEMIAIREILERGKVPYYDKNLTWGAALSTYREEIAHLKKNEIPVLVELRLDMDYPERSIIIDHHNDRAGKFQKTSLEQSAELLNIQLNRRQKLISANDRGHIPAMKELGATQQEMEEIRIFDRKSQGVTEDDEQRAIDAITNHSEEIAPDTIYVHSSTEKSSPVMDRLYQKYKHIFIVTPSNDLSYFGPGHIIDKLEAYYIELHRSKPEILFWKGGNLPDRGFFGSTFAIDKTEFIQILNGE